MTTHDESLAALESITAWFTRAFAELDEMNRDFCRLLEEATGVDDDVTRLAKAGRDVFKERVRTYLREHPRINGAGLIFSRSARGEGKGVTEWWVRDGADGMTRYQFGVNPLGQRFYDYEKLEWFTVSVSTGRPWLAGPYIDYLGVEEYVVTLTVRSEVHGRAVGVTGLDIKVGDLERELLPLLRLAGGPALLLNPHDAVLVSSSSRFSAGDVVHDVPEGFRRVPLPLENPPLTLLVSR